jgi:hypothetical protein
MVDMPAAIYLYPPVKVRYLNAFDTSIRHHAVLGFANFTDLNMDILAELGSEEEKGKIDAQAQTCWFICNLYMLDHIRPPRGKQQ